MIQKALVIIYFLTFSLISFASDGIKLVASSKEVKSGNVSLSTLYINSTSLVVKTNMKGTEATLLFDANKELLTYIDHSSKQYSVIDKATMKELGKQLEQMVVMIKAFYQNMPEETKKKFKPLIEGNAVNVDYKKIGSEKIASWSTTKYEALSSGEKVLVTNIASFSSLNIQKNNISALPKLLDLISTHLSGLAAIVPSGSIFTQWSGESNPMFNEGIPVKTITYTGNTAAEETTITSIENSSFKLSDFQIPSGYQQQKIDLNKSLK